MIDMKISDKELLQLLINLLEQEYGYDTAHKLINRAEMEYAILRTNEVLERR